MGEKIRRKKEIYTYDNRRNLSLIIENDILKNRSTLDLTRGYFNLLQKEEAGITQTYLWDGNVAGMSEEWQSGGNRETDTFHTSVTQYYFQDAINFTQSDISRLDSNAFYETTTYFYTCNAGTKDNNGMSFAQAWSNMTGGTSYGIENGRTLYAMINVASSWGLYGGLINIAPWQYASILFNKGLWQEKIKRKKDRAERGYSQYGSLNYPWMPSLAGDIDVLNPFNFGLFNRGWKEFVPESCMEDK